MTTTAPTADNSSATIDVQTAETIDDLTVEIVPNGLDGDLLCWQAYTAAVEAAADSLGRACPEVDGR